MSGGWFGNFPPGWPYTVTDEPPQPAEKDARVGKKGHLKYGSPYTIIAAKDDKVRIRVGRAESDWLTDEELQKNSREEK